MSTPRSKKDPAAVKLGRKGGLKGGKKRMEGLSAEERAELGRKGAQKRWGKAKDSTPRKPKLGRPLRAERFAAQHTIRVLADEAAAIREHLDAHQHFKVNDVMRALLRLGAEVAKREPGALEASVKEAAP